MRRTRTTEGGKRRRKAKGQAVRVEVRGKIKHDEEERGRKNVMKDRR